jgi:hypothetical protein
MSHGRPPPEEPALVNADERIPICYIMRFIANPFWNRLEHNRQATASLSPEQLLQKEGSNTGEIFLNVEKEGLE